MTVAEAEARSARAVNDRDGRKSRACRKWFVAQGLPALFVGGLSMRELAFAYNDAKGEQFGRLLKKYEEAKEAAGTILLSSLQRQIRQSRRRQRAPTGTQTAMLLHCSTCCARP